MLLILSSLFLPSTLLDLVVLFDVGQSSSVAFLSYFATASAICHRHRSPIVSAVHLLVLSWVFFSLEKNHSTIVSPACFSLFKRRLALVIQLFLVVWGLHDFSTSHTTRNARFSWTTIGRWLYYYMFQLLQALTFLCLEFKRVLILAYLKWQFRNTIRSVSTQSWNAKCLSF